MNKDLEMTLLLSSVNGYSGLISKAVDIGAVRYAYDLATEEINSLEKAKALALKSESEVFNTTLVELIDVKLSNSHEMFSNINKLLVSSVHMTREHDDKLKVVRLSLRIANIDALAKIALESDEEEYAKFFYSEIDTMKSELKALVDSFKLSHFQA